jgi:hypothetical protein
MLTRLQHLARWLRPARPVLVGMGALCLGLAAYLVIFGDPQRSDAVLLPAIIGVLWCLCAVVFINSFEAVPAPPTAEASGWTRFKHTLVRLWYGLLALAFLVVTVATLLLTNRLIGEALG